MENLVPLLTMVVIIINISNKNHMNIIKDLELNFLYFLPSHSRISIVIIKFQLS